MDIFSLSQESLWLITVVYDLGLALLLYRFFGKYGLYVAVVLGIVLGNLQGGKVSELIIFGSTYKVSMGAIGGTLDQHAEVYSYTYNGVIYYENEIVSVNIADSINAVWEGLAFFLPSLPLKDSGHISAVFDGMNLTLPIKLVATPE